MQLPDEVELRYKILREITILCSDIGILPMSDGPKWQALKKTLDSKADDITILVTEQFKEAGSRGGQKTKATQPPDYYRQIGAKGGRAKRGKKKEVNKYETVNYL